jgi:hypothetical protein
MRVQSKELVDIFKEFYDEITEDGCRNLNFDETNNEIEFFEDEAYQEIAEDINTPEDIIDCIAGIFDYEFSDYGYRYRGDEKGIEEYESEEDFCELEEFNELTQRLMQNKKKLADSIITAEITSGGTGWGGDDESRYYRDWYDEDTLESMLENIAEQNGCDVDEIDDEMFAEYVGGEVSQSEVTVSYNKETGKIETSSSHGLL